MNMPTNNDSRITVNGPNAGFWNTLPRPIIGLSPMDGVTDAAFRQVVAMEGAPDVTFTEFTSVGDICRGPEHLLSSLLYSEHERPVVAQLYGKDPVLFYQAAHVVCELGFDGLDINMGCPSKTVANHGGGAALIRVPETAKAIIRAAQQGVRDWANGQTLEDLEMDRERIRRIRQMNEERVRIWGDTPNIERRLIPVSVKTRLGYDSIVITDWLQELLDLDTHVTTI